MHCVQVHQFWMLLQPHDDNGIDLLVKYGLLFVGGVLRARKRYEDESLKPVFRGLLLKVMKFRTSCSTRWLTIGESNQGLQSARALGLEGIIKRCVEKGTASARLRMYVSHQNNDLRMLFLVARACCLVCLRHRFNLIDADRDATQWHHQGACQHCNL